MAKAHGLTEYEKSLEESINQMEDVDKERIFKSVESYQRRSKVILPLRPVFIQNDAFCNNYLINWY